MNVHDLDPDVLAIHLKIDDDGDFQVTIGHNLEEQDYEEGELEFFNDLLNGISFSINFLVSLTLLWLTNPRTTINLPLNV